MVWPVKQVVQRGGDGVLVGGGTGGAEVEHLFGRHEARRAAGGSGHGQAAHGRRLIGPAQAEVGELEDLAAGDLSSAGRCRA